MKILILAGADTTIPNNKNKTFWNLVKTKPAFLKSCQRAQKAFQATQKKNSSACILPLQKTISKSIEKKEAPPQKKRIRHKKRKPTSSQKRSSITTIFKEKKEQAYSFLTAAKQVILAPSEVLSPSRMLLWQQEATTVQKRKRLASCQTSPPIIEYDGVFDAESYHIRLFNCFTSNAALLEKNRFSYSIDYTKLYSNDIYQRLNLIRLLQEQNAEHLLQYDENAEIPTFIKNNTFYSSKHDALLQHDKIGKKLDLYHLFALDPSYIQSFGITFMKTKEDGFKTVEVRIPAEVSFTHHNNAHTEPVVIELSFPYDNTQTLGPCIHRFMRPLSQSTEKIVLDTFEDFRSKKLLEC